MQEPSQEVHKLDGVVPGRTQLPETIVPHGGAVDGYDSTQLHPGWHVLTGTYPRPVRY